MLAAWKIRFAPAEDATAVIFVTCTVGMPARSSSFVIAAPQRVLVPQVDVSSTASTPSSLKRRIICFAVCLLFFMEALSPVVVTK